MGDLEQIEIFAGFCATAISNAQMFQQALLECQWSNVLLELARNLFEDLDTIEHVVTKIMVNAAALLSCEKCSVFMVDRESQELYAKVFDVSPGGEWRAYHARQDASALSSVLLIGPASSVHSPRY